MNQAEEVIKYAKKLNTENLSALRSGNISIRYKDGFLSTSFIHAIKFNFVCLDIPKTHLPQN